MLTSHYQVFKEQLLHNLQYERNNLSKLSKIRLIIRLLPCVIFLNNLSKLRMTLTVLFLLVFTP